MSLDFTIPELHIGNAGTPPIQFYKQGLKIGGSGTTPTYQDIVLSGNGSLSLTNAKANGLNYLKLYGGCEQRNLPEGYAQTAYTYFNTSAYLTTDFVPTYDCKIEFEFKTGSTIVNNATTYLGVRPSASGNGGLRVAHITSGVWRIYGFGTYADSTDLALPDTRYKFVYDNGHAVLTTGDTVVFDYTFTNTGANTYPVTINGWNNAGTVTAGAEPCYVYKLKCWDNQSNLSLDYVSATYNTSVGFYNNASNSFKTATVGTLEAGAVCPCPEAPLDIICNNGAIKVVNPSGIPANYTQYEYLRSSGTQYIDLGYKGKGNTKVEIKFRYYQTSSATGSGRVFGSRQTSSNNAFAIGTSSGVVSSTGNKVFWCYDGQSFYVSDNTFALDEWQTVVFSATEHKINGETEGDDYTVTTFETPSNLMLFAFDNNGTIGCGYVDIAYCKLWDDDGTLVRDLIPAGNGTTYSMCDKVTNTLMPNAGTGDFTVGNAVAKVITIDGTTETVTDSLDNTATAQNLLAVGTVKDVQEILAGVVTRNIGIKVLDGTESWTKASGYTNIFYAPISGAYYNDSSAERIAVPCTHFLGTDATNTNMDDNSIKLTAQGSALTNPLIYIKASISNNDLTTWQTWLATQYQNGTPVIIVFPLKTATTETVTGQSLTTKKGSNTIEITQASINNLPLEVSYKGTV